MSRLRVCRTDELEPGDAVRVENEPPIAVFNVDGEFFATTDTCTHDESSLADGYVDGDIVECAWHMAKFCVRTGEVLSAPATVNLRSYSVDVVDDEIFVTVD